MPETAALLAVNELEAWYGELHVLHGVTFDVRPGEVVTLLGRNGVGKTTTLKAIMGIIESRTGSVRFEGRELIGRPSDAIARAGIAFCPEERGIFSSLDVKENLLLPPQVRPGGLDLDRIFELFPNLRERLSSQGTKLSGGEQQMLAIGRILRTGARLLLLDEPTEGSRSGHHPADRAHDRHAQGARFHHPAGRAELPLRRYPRRSLLRHGTWPHRRPLLGSRTKGQYRKAARVSRSLISRVERLKSGTRRRSPAQQGGLNEAYEQIGWSGRRTDVHDGGRAGAEQVSVKIGVLTDMSSLYSDIGGAGSVAAAKLAVEDFNPAAHGMKVEVVGADHQNKPDVGASIARQWYDVDHVDVIVDVPTSSVALAISDVTREKNKVFLGSGPASSDLTGPKCSPNTIQWTYDTWMLANGTGKAVVKTGGDTWFFLTADYAFGQALERDTAAGHRGQRRQGAWAACCHPLNTSDFSSFLLQAQASKAKIIGLANAGGDTVNAIKQGAEFGITAGGQHFAGLLVFINDVQALGLKTAQGLVLTETWYWDMTDANRAFTKRWQVARAGPVNSRAWCRPAYTPSVIHYLKAVEALKSGADGRAVVAKMKEMPTDDPSVRQRLDPCRRPQAPQRVFVRGEEARGIRNIRATTTKLRATIPAAEAFRPLKDGGCPLVSG